MYSNCPQTCGHCDEETTTIPTTSSTTTTAGCAKPNWKGDNWCDDVNNNEGIFLTTYLDEINDTLYSTCRM